MAKTKSKSKKKPSSPDSVLAGLLREVDQLRVDRDDDSVSAEEWHRRGKLAMMRSSRLPAAHAQVFQQHYLAMQQLEAAEQLEASLEQFDAEQDACAVEDEAVEDEAVEDEAASEGTSDPAHAPLQGSPGTPR